MMDIFSLKNKVAVVTGASVGLGRAMAEGLAEAGATVVGANRKREEGQEMAAAMRAKGLDVHSFPVDVADKASVQELFAYVAEQYGRLDILINNAGINRMKPILDYQDEDWDAVMDVDLRGTYWCCRAAFPLMKDKGGKILNLGSITAHKCLNNGSSIYSIAKQGINQLTRVFAVEWLPYKITVNAIAPGVCITRINEEHYARHPELLARVSAGIPIGRVSKPEEYKGIAVFLASSASDYMTGQVLYMDGGMSLV